MIPTHAYSHALRSVSQGLSLTRFWEQYRGARIFRTPLADETGRLVGNNGDKLIKLGADLFLTEFGISEVHDPTRADLIVFDGSGGMHDRASVIPDLFAHYAGAFPWTPLVMLPFTYDMRDNRLSQALAGHVAPVTLFCREMYSFNKLRRERVLPPNCFIGLDHDTAFNLQASEWVDELRKMEPRHVLIVDRLDKENRKKSVFRSFIGHGKAFLGPRLPHQVKRLTYPAVATMLGHMHSNYRAKCAHLLEHHVPKACSFPIVAKDISLPRVCEFEEFCRIIGGSAAVFTSRLHVGILAAIIGRPTFLFEGNYHKIRGIYEYSMTDWPHVRLVTDEAPIIRSSVPRLETRLSSKGA